MVLSFKLELLEVKVSDRVRGLEVMVRVRVRAGECIRSRKVLKKIEDKDMCGLQPVYVCVGVWFVHVSQPALARTTRRPSTSTQCGPMC